MSDVGKGFLQSSKLEGIASSLTENLKITTTELLQLPGEDFSNQLGGVALLESGIKKNVLKCFSYFMWLFLRLACFSASEL